MPVYNCEKYLEEAMTSLLSQSFRDFEVVVVDDGSKDRSSSILRGFNDERVKIVKNDQNLGLSASLNIGIEESHCDIIARMDADDVSMPERFEEQLKVLDGNASINFCHTNFEEIDERGNLLEPKWQNYGKLPTEWLLLWTNPIAHPSVMFRRSILPAKKQVFNGEYYPAEDYELWSRILSETTFHHIDRPLIKYRRVASSAFQTQPRRALLMSLKANLRMASELVGENVPDFHKNLTTFGGALGNTSVQGRYSVLADWYERLAAKIAQKKRWTEDTALLVSKDIEERLLGLLRSEPGVFKSAGTKVDLLLTNPFRLTAVWTSWTVRPVGKAIRSVGKRVLSLFRQPNAFRATGRSRS
jgi:glycosyltransferase involved in cell wall biosynthesis